MKSRNEVLFKEILKHDDIRHIYISALEIIKKSKKILKQADSIEEQDNKSVDDAFRRRQDKYALIDEADDLRNHANGMVCATKFLTDSPLEGDQSASNLLYWIFENEEVHEELYSFLYPYGTPD